MNIFRFQAECLDGVHYSGDRKWIIRAVQGHSHSIGRQMRDVDACETVDEWSGVNMAVHGTRFDLLPAIIGGGVPRTPARRAETHNQQQARTAHTRALPDRSQMTLDSLREGTDVAIRLGLPKMLADKIANFKSKADVLLLPNVVGPK